MKIENNNLVTIITVCKNADKLIERTLLSVLNQNDMNYELIVQDGLSNDNTMQVVIKYRAYFEQKGVSYRIYSESDSGIYNAMNKAVLKATGKYIIFMNAGDEFAHQGVIAKINEISNRQSADIFYGDSLMINENVIRLFVADMSLRKRMPFCHQACFVLRDILIKYPFDEHYRIVADLDFILRLREKNYVFKYIQTIVCKYYMDGISSKNFVSKRYEHEKILAKHNETNLFGCAMHMSEAVLKAIIVKILPNKLRMPLELYYLTRIKGYSMWNGEIY